MKNNLPNQIQIHWDPNKPEYYLIQLSGRLDLSNSRQMETEIIDQLKKDIRHLVVDLGSVNYMSSSGLGALITIQKYLLKFDKQLHLFNLTRNVIKIMQVVEVGRVFPVFENQDQATANLNESEP